MEQEIYNWIKNIVIYMIINTIIMNLLGNKSYKKYVSIVSGMILVLIVISPLVKLLKLEDNMDYYFQYNDFAIDSAEFKNEIEQVEEEQDEKIFSEYENKIKSQVKDLLSNENIYLETCNITLDQDAASETFGEITAMKIIGTTDEVQEASSNNLQIEDIEIQRIDIDSQDREETEEMLSPLEISVKNKLLDFYNMEQGNINISIQGG